MTFDDAITIDDVERELRRVTDRLASMPLSRLESTTSAVYACAERLVEIGRILGVPIPDDASLPQLGPQAYGDLIAVLGRDCLEVSGDDTDVSPLHTALVTLRRSLP
jgi:hypothetical protein